MRPLIIGVGNRWRCDDGLGPRAVDAIARSGYAEADLLELDGEPARLAAAWTGRPCVVVIDAIRSGAAPGTFHQLDGAGEIPNVVRDASTHGGGVAAGVGLSRALGTLPDRLVVLGVEPARVEHGDELSPEVAAVFDDVVGRAVREVSRACV